MEVVAPTSKMFSAGGDGRFTVAGLSSPVGGWTAWALGDFKSVCAGGGSIAVEGEANAELLNAGDDSAVSTGAWTLALSFSAGRGSV